MPSAFIFNTDFDEEADEFLCLKDKSHKRTSLLYNLGPSRSRIGNSLPIKLISPFSLAFSTIDKIGWSVMPSSTYPLHHGVSR